MNTLYCFHLKSDPDLRDAIIFRILLDKEDPKSIQENLNFVPK